MKIANRIFDSLKVGAINELIAQKLPISEAYSLMKFAKELSEKETIYREAKLKIFRMYGTEKDGIVSIKKGNEEKASKELEKLASLEEDYKFDKKIVLPKGLELSAQQLMLLEDFVEVK